MVRSHPARLSSRLRRAPTRYRPTKKLATGGMAEVWEGLAVFEDGDHHRVAIKRVLPKLVTQKLYRSMFEDEARLGMLLRHPNIVRIYDAREAGGTLIMIMELVSGCTLKDVMDPALERGAHMPVTTALYITQKLADGLAYAHNAEDLRGRPLGIIHRDVSPHNLLLGRDGAIKLADFGLAEASVHSSNLDEGMMGGKLGYLAPEVLAGHTPDTRIDLFATGIVLWEMLCGRRLFQRESDQDTVRAVARCDVPRAIDLNPDIPHEVQTLLNAMLAKEPDDRVASADDLSEWIEEILQERDPNLGRADIALMVGLRLAEDTSEERSPSGGFAKQLENELTEFAELAAGTYVDIGAEPLNPENFLTDY